MNKEPSMAASQQLLQHIRNSQDRGHDEEGGGALYGSDTLQLLPPEKKTFLQKVAAIVHPVAEHSATIGLTVLPQGFMLARCVMHNKQTSLRDVRFYALPVGVAPDSPAGGECLRRALSSFAPNYAQCTIWQALPEGSGEVYALQLPKVKSAELDAVALLAARKEKAFDPAATIFDYRVLEEKFDKGVPRLSLIATALPRASVVHLQHYAAKVGFKAGGAAAPMLYAYNLFASGWLKSPWERFAVVYIEDEASHLGIFRNKELLLRRSIRTSSQVMLQALEEYLQEQNLAPEQPPREPAEPVYAIDSTTALDPLSSLESPLWFVENPTQQPAQPDSSLEGQENDADDMPQRVLYAISEEHKQQAARLLYAGAQQEEEQDILRKALMPVLERLARQVDRTVVHFRNTIDNAGVQGLLVLSPVGSAALVQEFFKEELALPCLGLQLDGENTCQQQIAQLLRTPEYAAVLHSVGLALANKSTPNAIMTYKDEQKAHKHLLTGWAASLAAGAFLVGSCGLALEQYIQWQESRQRIAAYQTQKDDWKEPFTVAVLQKEMAELAALHQQGIAMVPRRLPAALISELGAIVPPSIHITEMSLVFSAPAQGKLEPKTAQQEKKNDHIVVLRGVVYGDILQRETRLAEFFNELEHSPLVLSMSIQKEPSAGDSIVFVATMKVL